MISAKWIGPDPKSDTQWDAAHVYVSLRYWHLPTTSGGMKKLSHAKCWKQRVLFSPSLQRNRLQGLFSRCFKLRWINQICNVTLALSREESARGRLGLIFPSQTSVQIIHSCNKDSALNNHLHEREEKQERDHRKTERLFYKDDRVSVSRAAQHKSISTQQAPSWRLLVATHSRGSISISKGKPWLLMWRATTT